MKYYEDHYLFLTISHILSCTLHFLSHVTHSTALQAKYSYFPNLQLKKLSKNSQLILRFKQVNKKQNTQVRLRAHSSLISTETFCLF